MQICSGISIVTHRGTHTDTCENFFSAKYKLFYLILFDNFFVVLVKNFNCKLWLLGEPKAEFNIPNSVNLCAISYDTMLGKPKFGVDLIDATTQSSDGSELNLKPEFLSQAIRQSVKMIPDDVWNRVNSSNPTIRNSVLALCVINGILVAKQCLSTQGLSKVYALLGQELLQAVEKFLSSVGPNDSGSSSLNEIIDDDSMTVMRGSNREKASEELVEFLVQVS